MFYNWKGQLRTRAKKLKQIQDGKTGVEDRLALQKISDVEKRALKLWKEDFQDKDIASVSNFRFFSSLVSICERDAKSDAEKYEREMRKTRSEISFSHHFLLCDYF